MADPQPHVLHQRDLSRLRVQQMNQAERAELLRRYSDFVDHFRIGEEEPKPRTVRKWVPGESS